MQKNIQAKHIDVNCAITTSPWHLLCFFIKLNFLEGGQISMLARLISNINCKTETNCSCSVTNKLSHHHHQGEMSLLAEQHNIWVTTLP